MVSFKHATKEMKPCLINAMCECFGDSKENVNYFFDNKFSAENCFVCVKDGAATALLHTMEQKLILNEKIYKSSYIYAACTLPQYRNQGYMKKLLKYTEDCLEAKGNCFTFLVPGSLDLVNFYQKAGYQNFFKTKTIFLEKDDITKRFYEKPSNSINFSETSVEYLRFSVYNKFNGIMYSDKDIEYAKKFYERFGGKTVYAPKGYAICVPIDDSVLEVKDFTCNSSSLSHIMSEIINCFPNYENYLIKTNPENTLFENMLPQICKSTNFYGMIKPLKSEYCQIIKNFETNAYLGLALD